MMNRDRGLRARETEMDYVTMWVDKDRLKAGKKTETETETDTEAVVKYAAKPKKPQPLALVVKMHLQLWIYKSTTYTCMRMFMSVFVSCWFLKLSSFWEAGLSFCGSATC